MRINFSGIGFNDPQLQTIEIKIEIYIDNRLTNSETQVAPFIFACQQCQQLINEVAHRQDPIKVIIRGSKEVQMSNGDWIKRPSILAYANNAHIEKYGDDLV